MSKEIPTVSFDATKVTETVKADLSQNLQAIREIPSGDFEVIYDAALRSISVGRALDILYQALMTLDGMSKRRAKKISLSLNNKATALMNAEQQERLGIKYANAGWDSFLNGSRGKSAGITELNFSWNGSNWRRLKQAGEALDGAKEAEDFQTVGMRCRECLLALVRTYAIDIKIPEGQERPKAGNFIHWAELIADSKAHGESAKDVRSHLMHTINYLLHLSWRIIFFPFAMLALLAAGGWHGFVTFVTFGVIVHALRLVRLP